MSEQQKPLPDEVEYALSILASAGGSVSNETILLAGKAARGEISYDDAIQLILDEYRVKQS